MPEDSSDNPKASTENKERDLRGTLEVASTSEAVIACVCLNAFFFECCQEKGIPKALLIFFIVFTVT